MSDPNYCTGEYSYWENAKRAGASGFEVSQAMPPGWAQDSATETRSGTIHRNAVEALWLPLFIPEGCDGHKGDLDPVTGELLPEVCYYATNGLDSQFDQQFGEAHSSAEVDEARYQHAVELGLDAATYTSGAGPNVRPNE